MLIAAIAAGCLTWLAVSLIAGPYLYGSLGAGAFPGFVACLWVMWLAYLPARKIRNDFLHPRPKSYQVSSKDALSKVQACMGEGNIRYGEPWECTDAAAGRVAYLLKWTEREVRGQSGHFVKVEDRMVNLARELYLEVKLLEKIPGYTIVQLHWFARAQENQDACDHVISTTTADIDNALGGGIEVPKQATTWLEPPPVPLLSLTVVMLLILLIDVGKTFHTGRLDADIERREFAEARQRYDDERDSMKDELNSWIQYREANGIE